MSIRCFQVPQFDVAPSDEMVEWLHLMPQEWEGDPSGIVMYSSEEEAMDPKMAEPGDYIVSYNGVYVIVTQKDLDEDPDLLKNLGVEKVET